MVVRTFHSHTVYLRQKWSDDWVVQPYLYADLAVHRVSSGFPEAHLVYDYGRKQRPDQTSFDIYPALEILDWFVKVEYEAEGLDNWYGIVTEEGENLDGNQETTTDDIRTGTQMFTAYGLEWLLDRKQVDESVFEFDEALTQSTGRAITFNGGTGDTPVRGPVGNRSAEEGPDNIYVFRSVSQEGTAIWSGRDILAYLLFYFGPRNSDNERAPIFELDFSFATSQVDDLDWIYPVIPAEGRTVYEIINQVVNPHRIMTWLVRVDEETNKAKLSVVSFTKTLITTDTPGHFIAPNPGQKFLNFDRDPRYVARVNRTTSAKFHRVRVRGERSTVTATLSGEDEHFVKGWTDDLETAYETGAAVGGDRVDEQDANRHFREQDRFLPVYRYFKLNTSSGFNNLSTEDTRPVWLPGIRFLNKLPLVYGFSYEELPPTQAVTPNLDPPFLDPIVFVKDEDDKYRRIDALSQSANNENISRQWQCSVKMADDFPGFILDVQGAPQTAIAKDDFTPTDPSDVADFVPGELNWQDIKATICAESDWHCEGIYPEVLPPEVSEETMFRELVIEGIRGARQDYIEPETVVGVEANGTTLLKCTAGGYINDDRERLKELARLAYEWYSTPRKAMTLVKKSTDTDIKVGNLITTIGEGSTLQQINSVVTSLAVDTLSGTITIQTDFANLDVRAI